MGNKRHIIACVFTLIVLITQSYTQTLYNGVGHIPGPYQVNWHEAGLRQNMGNLEPKMVYQISPGTADSLVNDAIDLARSIVKQYNGLAIINFPEGTYNFNSCIPLTSPDRNVVFQGAGPDKTMIVFYNS